MKIQDIYYSGPNNYPTVETVVDEPYILRVKYIKSIYEMSPSDIRVKVDVIDNPDVEYIYDKHVSIADSYKYINLTKFIPINETITHNNLIFQIDEYNKVDTNNGAIILFAMCTLLTSDSIDTVMPDESIYESVKTDVTRINIANKSLRETLSGYNFSIAQYNDEYKDNIIHKSYGYLMNRINYMKTEEDRYVYGDAISAAKTYSILPIGVRDRIRQMHMKYDNSLSIKYSDIESTESAYYIISTISDLIFSKTGINMVTGDNGSSKPYTELFTSYLKLKRGNYYIDIVVTANTDEFDNNVVIDYEIDFYIPTVDVTYSMVIDAQRFTTPYYHTNISDLIIVRNDIEGIERFTMNCNSAIHDVNMIISNALVILCDDKLTNISDIDAALIDSKNNAPDELAYELPFNYRGTWDISEEYNCFDLVKDENQSVYFAKRTIPIGTSLSNESYWFNVA